jgi:hypothetical protein
MGEDGGGDVAGGVGLAEGAGAVGHHVEQGGLANREATTAGRSRSRSRWMAAPWRTSISVLPRSWPGAGG